MTRPRVALSIGAFLLVGTPAASAVIGELVILRGDYAFYDPTIAILVVVNLASLLAAWLLLAYGFVTWREQRQGQRTASPTSIPAVSGKG